MTRPFRVVVTGSECTGKTTLARRLAEHFHAPWSAEYVRQWVAREGRAPLRDDVEAIAAGQIDGEDAAIRAAGPLVIFDTDLLSTVIYSRHYFGSCPPTVEAAAECRRPDLYLIGGIDVPWIADGAQRDRPQARSDLHRMFSTTVQASGVPWAPLAGSPGTRLRAAIAAVGWARRMA